jgi:putative SOS response-associated peptidase YedK
MCGKFTAKASWADIVDFIHAGAARAADRSVVFRVTGNLPVIVRHDGARRVAPMRWGFPDPSDWRRPRPIHARGETIDSVPAFARAFRDGQRGIVLVESFCEAPDGGRQHVVTPTGPIGIAFLWRRFAIAGLPAPLVACVMATAPANALIAGLPADRMPAVLAPEDWAIWLGEIPAPADVVKACLRTVEDVRWTMHPEERGKRRGAASGPGLF